jgi:hypothetical protein
MILRQIADRLIRSLSGGENGVDNKYSPPYVEALIPSLRNDAIILDYYGGKTRAASKRLDYALYQTVDLEVNAVNNNLDYVTFDLPRTIGVGRLIDGLVYVGKIDNSVEFSRLLNRSDVAMMKARGLLDGTNIAYIWSQGKLEVYGNNALSECQVRGIFADPTQVPNFRIEEDDYPISENLLLLMVDLFKDEMNINVQMPADNVLDGKQTLPRQ